MTMTTADPMELAHAERSDLADLLATLSPRQWEAPSLCRGWRVRDVVAHMFSYEELTPLGLAKRFLGGGLLLDRVNAAGVALAADQPISDLLDLVGRNLRPRGLTRGFGGRIALLDGVVHHQDIRRPLGLPREVPADRLRCALEFARLGAVPVGAPLRARGLTLTATDLGWSRGRGPEVSAPGEALLMALAGRLVAAEELSGPGVATLCGRLPAG